MAHCWAFIKASFQGKNIALIDPEAFATLLLSGVRIVSPEAWQVDIEQELHGYLGA